jgi:hypothetical protein
MERVDTHCLVEKKSAMDVPEYPADVFEIFRTCGLSVEAAASPAGISSSIIKR